MSFSSGDLHDKATKVKWYDKKWFMWCMLIFFWPAGAYLLYRHRDEYTPKKAKLIAAGTGCFWLFMSLTSPQSPQSSQPPAQEVEMTAEPASAEVEQSEDKPVEAAQEEQKSETATANGSPAQPAGAAAAGAAATTTRAVQKATSAGSANVNATYLGNPKSMKFHRPGCRTIKHPERFVSLSSRDEAVASGYKPCGVCNP